MLPAGFLHARPCRLPRGSQRLAGGGNGVLGIGQLPVEYIGSLQQSTQLFAAGLRLHAKLKDLVQVGAVLAAQVSQQGQPLLHFLQLCWIMAHGFQCDSRVVRQLTQAHRAGFGAFEESSQLGIPLDCLAELGHRGTEVFLRLT